MPRSTFARPLGDGSLTLTQAERDPDEEGDYFAFEQLMAEGVAKKGKPEKKKEGKKSKTETSPEDVRS